MQYKMNILIGIFVSCLICSNLLACKITSVAGIDFSVGLIVFPITFLITDIISEVFGKQKARQVIYVGLLSMVFVLMLITISVLLPTSGRSYITHGEFSKVFGLSIRMQIASITAFLLSQMHDIWAFHFLKMKTKGRMLWLRNNISTIGSQLIDSIVFMFIAFWHLPDFIANNIPLIQNTSEKFNVEYIFVLLLPWWGLKVLIALFDTPFVYLGVRWLKHSSTEVKSGG